ncbi:MAG TPA: 16S rRNA (cytosine(967)-C(5))-methyltransferase RsmB [Methylophilaceae bacterium]
MHISQNLAAKAVSEVFAGRNLTITLEQLFKQHPEITPQQRGVAQDLSYSCLRHYGELKALIKPLLQKPLKDPWLNHLLLIAIYQLRYETAQPFTVVDQAVKAASKTNLPWAKGLVNGVLRNFLREQTSLIAGSQEDDVAKYSYPQWWVNKIKSQYPQQWQTILQAGNQHPPMVLRVNIRKTTQSAYQQLLNDAGHAAAVLGDVALLLEKPVSVEQLPHFADGWVSVQDYGAQLAAAFLEVQDGMRVLDACCAPGGKTGHLLESANIEMTALDHNEIRLKRVAENLSRLDLSANLKQGDASKSDWWDGKLFDRILADVPCTASGVVRRHVDIKWLRREADIASFSQQQALILSSLWQMLAKGGKLLYVTCSIFHEENQAQIDNFLKNNADAERVPLNLVLQTESEPLVNLQQVSLQKEKMEDRQLLPCKQHDGFFYALLQKR